jgi:hypothetical protein
MVQFPLALAVEPRLLPYAVANGFQMDTKVKSQLCATFNVYVSFDSTVILSSERCLSGRPFPTRPAPTRLSTMFGSYQGWILREYHWMVRNLVVNCAVWDQNVFEPHRCGRGLYGGEIE